MITVAKHATMGFQAYGMTYRQQDAVNRQDPGEQITNVVVGEVLRLWVNSLQGTVLVHRPPVSLHQAFVKVKHNSQPFLFCSGRLGSWWGLDHLPRPADLSYIVVYRIRIFLSRTCSFVTHAGIVLSLPLVRK